MNWRSSISSVSSHKAVTVFQSRLYAQISHNKHSHGAYNLDHLFDMHFHI